MRSVFFLGGDYKAIVDQPLLFLVSKRRTLLALLFRYDNLFNRRGDAVLVGYHIEDTAKQQEQLCAIRSVPLST